MFIRSRYQASKGASSLSIIWKFLAKIEKKDLHCMRMGKADRCQWTPWYRNLQCGCEDILIVTFDLWCSRNRIDDLIVLFPGASTISRQEKTCIAQVCLKAGFDFKERDGQLDVPNHWIDELASKATLAASFDLGVG
jgi:hypothetical protein